MPLAIFGSLIPINSIIFIKGMLMQINRRLL
jgi:hypothetical protein